ncbi:MAG: hypothetical protein Q9180_005427 [Flavoplaca navasiana]
MSLSTCSITAADGRSPKSNRISKPRKARKQKMRALALHNPSQTITSTPSTSRSKGDDVQFVQHVVLLDPQIKDKDFNMVQAAHDWIQHHPKIKSAPRTRGGWERWVQMDLCLTLKSAGYDVKCEEKCFEDKRLRCDLLIHHPPPSDSERPKSDRYLLPASTHSPICEYYDVVELKCQLMDESIEEFYTRFKKDIKKLMDKPLKEPLHNWTTQRWALGLSVVPPYRTDDQQKSYLDQVHWGFWHGLTQIHCHHLVTDRGLIITAWHTALSPAFEEVQVKSCLFGTMD